MNNPAFAHFQQDKNATTTRLLLKKQKKVVKNILGKHHFNS